MSARRSAAAQPQNNSSDSPAAGQAGTRASARRQPRVETPKQALPHKPSAFAGARLRWHFVLDGAVLAILLGVAVLGFGPTFGHSPAYLVAGIGAIVLGLGVAAMGAHWRFGLIPLVGVGFLVYMLFGSALAALLEAATDSCTAGGNQC